MRELYKRVMARQSCSCTRRCISRDDFNNRTDASDNAISFNLGYVKEGKYVIAFGARGLRPAERNYTICEKEYLAIVVGIPRVLGTKAVSYKDG